MDRDLVDAAQRADRAAFVDLIQPRSGRLFSIAFRVLRDVDRAEDALQDALVIAWRDLRSLRDPDRFDAWLTRLVVHVCIGQASRERRRVINLRALPTDGPAAPDALLTVADLEVASTWKTTCPNHVGPYVMVSVAGTVGEYGVPSDSRVHITFVDVGGKTLLIETYGPVDAAAFATTIAAVSPVIASMRFGGG